nr:MAG TPA: hypothetical protein [Bacteriophage sp.]
MLQIYFVNKCLKLRFHCHSYICKTTKLYYFCH